MNQILDFFFQIEKNRNSIVDCRADLHLNLQFSNVNQRLNAILLHIYIPVTQIQILTSFLVWQTCLKTSCHHYEEPEEYVGVIWYETELSAMLTSFIFGFQPLLKVSGTFLHQQN